MIVFLRNFENLTVFGDFNGFLSTRGMQKKFWSEDPSKKIGDNVQGVQVNITHFDRLKWVLTYPV